LENSQTALLASLAFMSVHQRLVWALLAFMSVHQRSAWALLAFIGVHQRLENPDIKLCLASDKGLQRIRRHLVLRRRQDRCQ